MDADNMSEDSSKNQFVDLGYKVINCTDGNKVMRQYGITEGKKVADKMHDLRVLYLKNRN